MCVCVCVCVRVCVCVCRRASEDVIESVSEGVSVKGEGLKGCAAVTWRCGGYGELHPLH